MDRYGNLDLDLECEDGGETGGSVSHKAGLFDGMFKKSSKSAKPSTKTQDSLSANGELSNSSDSLTDNNNKEKGGMFKGMFRKMNKPANEDEPQTSVSLQNPELSASNDSLTDKSSKDKSGMFSGILKRSPRPGHVRRPSQDLLEISATDENLSDNNNKEAGGMFSGMFKKAPKPNGMKAASKEDLSADSELAESNKNLSSTKDSGGMFSSMFKKPFGARGQSQEDLTASSELSRSSDNLSEKETGGLFSGMFRKKGARSQSQDDLSVDDEQSAITDNQAEKPSKGGQAAKMLKNPFTTSAQDKMENSGEMNENNSAAQKPKAKTNGLSAVMKSTFYTEKQEKNSKTNDEEKSNEDGDQQPDHKQSKLSGAMMKLNPFQAGNKKQTGSDDEDQTKSSEKSSTHKQSTMIEAMSKLNPFRSAAKKETEDSEILEKNRKQLETKPNPVKSNMIQPDRRKRSEAMSVTTNSPEEKVKSPREMKGKPSEAPKVPPKPSEEELNRATGHQWTSTKPEDKCGDRGNTENESTVTKNSDENQPESKPTKVKKQKHPNPFMPQAAVKAASDDEGLKNDEESSSREEKKTEDDGKEKAEEPKVKKPKKKNPFMPRVKAKVIQRQVPDGGAGDTAENEPSRSLFDQLEDFRLEPSQPEDSQDVEDLMEWWNTVETWEDTPQIDDMTEKEEAKAFAVTAEKVQKGIRVFNKLFTERAESLWQHVIDLNSIADGLDKFNKNTKIAQITGGSTSAIGGVATIAGLALAPVTMGTSLIVTAVGLGVATAGGLTSAGAGISNQVNNSMDRKKVERIVEDYQEKITDLNKCLKFIKQGIENLRKFDLLKMKKHAYNQDFPALTSQFYEDGAMAGKAILINANEIMRVVQIANVAGSTAARAVQIASMATGVLTGLFVGMDIYFVAKDSKELKKGAKSEFAAKIREVAMQLHEGLVELNSIHEELKSTRSDDDTSNPTRGSHNEKKDKEDKCDSSDEEDEIDRIKKEIKKNIENREYV